MTRCPHCFRSVLTTHTGHCPACGNDTNDLTGVDPEMDPLVVSEKPQLPQVCCSCGEWTKRQVKVAYVRNSQSGREETMLSPLKTTLILSLLSPLIAIFASLFQRPRDNSSLEVTTHLTLCKNCDRKAELEPVRVDYDRCTMEFAVHREFAREYREINASEK